MKLCIALAEEAGGAYEVVQAAHERAVSRPMFAFKVLDDMRSRQMDGLAEQLAAYVGVNSGL